MDVRGILGVGDAVVVRELVAAVRGRGVRVWGPFAPSIAVAAGIAPELAVVDLRVCGVAAVRETVDAFPATRVMAAGTDDDAVTAEVLGIGACGVIPQEPRLRWDALRRAAAGEIVVPDGRLAAILGSLGQPRRTDDAARLDVLTSREREVLQMIAEGASTTHVAVTLGIAPATVQSHVKNLLAKLGVHSKVEAARVAWRVGITGVPAGV